jgi:cell division protein FtsB
MEDSRPTRSRWARGVGVAAAALLVGSLVWTFGIQIINGLRVRAEERRLENAVATEQARHDELVDELEYTKSDEYVEFWARTEARMAKPGEVVVVPTEEVESQPADPTPTPEPEGEPFWVTLWRLLFPEPEP